MKRIGTLVRDIFEITVLVALLGIGIFAEISANAQTVRQQDLYQIEQSFDHEFLVHDLAIQSGWDARLIQVPEGTPTRVVITTPCANYFEEGEEPNLLSVSRYKKYDGTYTLMQNQWMPRTTVVEIFTAQPLDDITLEKNARLTIAYFDFDTIDLEITADSGAVLIVDTLINHGKTEISGEDATLDLRHLRGNILKIWTRGVCHVTEGDIQTSIPRTKEQGKNFKIHMLNLNVGVGLSTPLWVENSRYGSPYNTNRTFELHIMFRSNDVPINRHISWDCGLDAKAAWSQLDNAVMVQGDQFVLDPSLGATPPRQYLYWWSIGVPVTLKFEFAGKSHPTVGFFTTLTPTFNFKPRLLSKSLDANDHWNSTTEKADILNRFNVRAAFGLYAPSLGKGKLEFFVDLLPTYKSSANAPQTRMFGLNFYF